MSFKRILLLLIFCFAAVFSFANKSIIKNQLTATAQFVGTSMMVCHMQQRVYDQRFDRLLVSDFYEPKPLTKPVAKT